MKTIRLSQSALRISALLALAIGLSSSAIAGPGPEYWAARAREQAERTKKAELAKPTVAPAMACASCQMTAIRQFYPAAAGGKVPASYGRVGTKHECALCGGAITVVRGVTTNTMKTNCPTCAQAVPNCCTVKGANT